MACRIDNELGHITIPEEVIATLAGSTAMECYGIVAMASKRASDSFVELFGGENLSRGVKVTAGDDGFIDIHLFVVVEYGVSIAAVAQSAMEAIKYSIENNTGTRVSSVNITVEGIRV